MKKYFLDVLKLQYADFKGRASRRQFWMFVLYNVIAAVIVGIIGGIVGLNAILSGLYSLALLIPSLAISVRRLQDIDKEWYWILISLIPLVGSIWLIVLYCQPGTPSDKCPTPNKRSRNPRNRPGRSNGTPRFFAA